MSDNKPESKFKVGECVRLKDLPKSGTAVAVRVAEVRAAHLLPITTNKTNGELINVGDWWFYELSGFGKELFDERLLENAVNPASGKVEAEGEKRSREQKKSDAIADAMNLILPVLQAKHATIIEAARKGSPPIPPNLFNSVRKLNGKLSLSITHKTPTPSSYMQQIAGGISDAREMCMLAVLAVGTGPFGSSDTLVLVVHNNVRGIQLWTKDGQDALCIHPFEFGIPLSASAGK